MGKVEISDNFVPNFKKEKKCKQVAIIRMLI